MLNRYQIRYLQYEQFERSARFSNKRKLEYSNGKRIDGVLDSQRNDFPQIQHILPICVVTLY